MNERQRRSRMRRRVGRGWLQHAHGNDSAAHCIAYLDSGHICNATATILDLQRGGMVCLEHAPKNETPPTRTPI